MITPAQKRRIVAIVGRPNVGKSAIFNRLARARIAIVHAESGVTRDRLMREIVWRGHAFDLVDTGGICNLDKAKLRDEIEAGVRRQADVALEDAAAAILVVDIEAGLLPLDEEVAGLLRARGCFTVVAVNKADHAGRDAKAGEFARLGFPVYPVSALHDRGFDALVAPVVRALPDVPNVTMASPLKLAVVGRPNVGKSSYINRLLESERVIVSAVPGTTRDSIDVPFVIGEGAQARHYLLTDTAGIRRVRKIDTSVERFGVFRAEQSIARADVAALLFDAEQGPTAQDKRIAATIMEHDKGCVLVVNKWDLAHVSPREYSKEIYRALPFMAHCPIAFVSAKTGRDIRSSVDAVDHVASQVQADLPTGVLNRTVIDAFERVQPPMVGGKRLKIFYATQVGHKPIRVRIFVNDPCLAPQAYCDYLVRTMREKFGLEGAPVRLRFSARKRELLRPQASQSKSRRSSR